MLMKKLLYIISNLRKVIAYFSNDSVFDNQLGFALKILTFLILFSVTYNLFAHTSSNQPTHFSRAENCIIKCEGTYTSSLPFITPNFSFSDTTGSDDFRGRCKNFFVHGDNNVSCAAFSAGRKSVGAIKAFNEGNCLQRIR